MHRIILLSRPSRPTPRRQAPLPPFDPSDSGGQVHTTPPPELVVPKGYDPAFLRADFNGVTLDMSRWAHLGPIPMLVGANTTPPNMLLSPMAILYPRPWQDAILTEHAERYTHFVIAPDGWNLTDNGFDPSVGAITAWAQYVKSWGFGVVLWRSQPTPNDPYLAALVNARAVDVYLVGEEIDGKIRAEDLTAVLDTNLAIVANGIPVCAHFRANWPSGFPGDTFFDGRSMPSLARWDGRVHIAWQANQRDSAGTQAARLYYARMRVNLGLVGDGTYTDPAPNSRVYAFETEASAQFDPRAWTPPRPDAVNQYGGCTEEYGCLRSLELMYATRTDDRIQPMAGYGNGCRLPDGSLM